MVSSSMIAIFPASCYRQSRRFSVDAQREAVRRYLVSHHGEQIVFVEVESGKRSDRPELAAAMALAKSPCWLRSSIGFPAARRSLPR
jgi:hypothetical protein